MPDQPTIGDHLRMRRMHVGLTQEQLAELAGLSVETIRKLEQSVNTSARMSTLNRLARALGVPTSTLLGNAAQSAARRERDFDGVALMPLRQVLLPARGLRGAVVGGPEVAPPTLADIRMSIRIVDQAYHADDYAATLSALPALIAEAAAGVDATAGHGREQALALLAQAYQVAATALIQLRSLDLAHEALGRALDAADTAGDQVVGASAVVTMCWLLLRMGRFAEAESLAVVTADAVEPQFRRAAPAELATWGWLMLRAAAAAVRDNRDDDAQELLDAADAAAARIGDRIPEAVVSPGPATVGAFGSTTVAMKRVETAVIAGDNRRALVLAEGVQLDGATHGRPTSNNRNRHLLDVAHAQARVGAHDAAEETLLRIRTDAPTWLRQQRYARDIVREIRSHKKRKISRELAQLAELVGLEE